MASKVTISIFMVLLAFTATAKAHKLNGAIDDLVNNLQIVVDAAVDSAQTLINKAQTTLVSLANSTIIKSETAMNGTVEDFTEKLALIKQNAAEANITIDDCLGDNETNITNIPTDFDADLTECVNTTVTEGLTYVQKSLDDINVLVDKVEDIRKDVKACGTGFTSLPCLAKLTTQITLLTASLPVQIAANSAAAVTQITQLSLSVDKCANDSTTTYTAKGDALLATIKKCVEDKQ